MVRWCGRTAARRNGSALYQTKSPSPRNPRTPSARVGHPGDVGDAGAAVGEPRKGEEQVRQAVEGHQVLLAHPCLAREPHHPPLRPPRGGAPPPAAPPGGTPYAPGGAPPPPASRPGG